MFYFVSWRDHFCAFLYQSKADPGIFNGGGAQTFLKKKSGSTWAPTHSQVPCSCKNKGAHDTVPSSIASPIWQEGQSERTFPIFAFSSWFFLFFSDFAWFFPLSHPLIFGIFFFCCQVWHSAPLAPQWLLGVLPLNPLLPAVI